MSESRKGADHSYTTVIFEPPVCLRAARFAPSLCENGTHAAPFRTTNAGARTLNHRPTPGEACGAGLARGIGVPSPTPAAPALCEAGTGERAAQRQHRDLRSGRGSTHSQSPPHPGGSLRGGLGPRDRCAKPLPRRSRPVRGRHGGACRAAAAPGPPQRTREHAFSITAPPRGKLAGRAWPAGSVRQAPPPPLPPCARPARGSVPRSGSTGTSAADAGARILNHRPHPGGSLRGGLGPRDRCAKPHPRRSRPVRGRHGGACRAAAPRISSRRPRRCPRARRRGGRRRGPRAGRNRRAMTGGTPPRVREPASPPPRPSRRGATGPRHPAELRGGGHRRRGERRPNPRHLPLAGRLRFDAHPAGVRCRRGFHRRVVVNPDLRPQTRLPGGRRGGRDPFAGVDSCRAPDQQQRADGKEEAGDAGGSHARVFGAAVPPLQPRPPAGAGTHRPPRKKRHDSPKRPRTRGPSAVSVTPRHGPRIRWLHRHPRQPDVENPNIHLTVRRASGYLTRTDHERHRPHRTHRTRTDRFPTGQALGGRRRRPARAAARTHPRHRGGPGERFGPHRIHREPRPPGGVGLRRLRRRPAACRGAVVAG